MRFTTRPITALRPIGDLPEHRLLMVEAINNLSFMFMRRSNSNETLQRCVGGGGQLFVSYWVGTFKAYSLFLGLQKIKNKPKISLRLLAHGYSGSYFFIITPKVLLLLFLITRKLLKPLQTCVLYTFAVLAITPTLYWVNEITVFIQNIVSNNLFSSGTIAEQPTSDAVSDWPEPVPWPLHLWTVPKTKRRRNVVHVSDENPEHSMSWIVSGRVLAIRRRNATAEITRIY